MIKHILLCIDDQEHTRKAEDYAIDILKNSQASLSVLHVIDNFIVKSRFVMEIFSSGREEYVEYANRELLALADRVVSNFREKAKKEGVDFKLVMRRGDPHDEILKEAKKGYDLVIIGGKKDRRGVRKILREDTTGKVFRGIKSPLLVVK
jgi:nucleotide-binding universal stress UspA family protein